MAPFLITDSPAVSSTATLVNNDASKASPFSRAAVEFLAELKKRDDAKNPFVRELHNQHLVQAGSGATQSQVSAAELRDFVSRLQAQKRTGRSHQMLTRVGPFIDGLQKLMMACENLAQAAPFGVSVAFSGARIVLELAIKMNNYLEAVVDALDEIGVSLKCYGKFAEAHDSSADMQDLLASSYKQILKFWYDVSHTLSQNMFKTVLKSVAKPLDKDIKTALDGLRRDSIKVLTLAQATAAQQTRQDREAAQRGAIVKWIMGDKHVDARIDLKDQLDRRHEGTCQWMFEDQRFRDWRDATENAALWYNAPPGSGKSVFAATIVDHLVKRGEKVVYFFYSFSDSVRRHGINGLRSLALQLLTLVTTLPDKLVDMYQTEMKNHAITLNALHDAIHAVHELATQCEHVYIVVDGLDECIQESTILLSLEHLIQMPTYGTVKWLFTSRNHTSIRSVMEGLNAVEIQPERSFISKDIHAYFSSHITCHDCVDNWTEDEDNFLYARLVCETLRGEGLTCEEEIDMALRKFPKDLNGYYMRSLEKLSEKTEEEQELARRTFLILIAAAQSVSLNELLEALAVRRGAKDHKASRVSSAGVIEDLCSPLVVFDRPNQESNLDNPRLKLCHKTVEDFFMQDQDSISAEGRQHLRKYFVTQDSANQELGLDCLTYLQYERYQKPGLDLPSILAQVPTPRNHAFLPYAATFWAQHLMDIRPSPPITEMVRAFLKSPAFWTCIAVQSRVVPYLFGRFARRGGGSYTMGVRGLQWRDEDFSGLPLPTWLDCCSEEGMLLDRSLCCFVNEWREVLTTSPAGLELCLPLRHFDASCHLIPLEKSKVVRVAQLEESIDGISSFADVRLVDTTFVGRTLWADVLCRGDESGGNVGQFKRMRIPLFSKKNPTSSTHRLPIIRGDEAGGTIFIAQRTKSPDSVQVLRINPETLGVRLTMQDHSEEHNPPIPFSKENVGRRGTWEVVSTQDVGPDTSRDSSMRILHATWQKYKPVLQTGVCQSQGEDREDDKDDSHSSESEDESDDDSDSDTEPDAESTKSLSDTKAEAAHETPSETDYESDSDELVSDCLIVVPLNSRPVWHAWCGQPRVWSRVTCAVHPLLPLVVVSHTARQLEVINTAEHTQRKKHLPEQADLQEAPLASLRELRFSACGTFLHFLSISFVPDKASTTTARVTVSTFNFNHEGGSDDTLLREGQARRCTYTFDGMPLPLALTYWSDAEVVIALPPLTCDPKILKISLPQRPASNGQGTDCEDANSILTLREAIYFPTSSPRRNPRLSYRDGGGGQKAEDSSYIYLALDTLAPDKASKALGQRVGTLRSGSNAPPPLTSDTEDGRTGEPSLVSPPVVLRWKIAQAGGWRTWNPELDGQASDTRRGLSVWEMLRGAFVDSDKAFSVPVRSGLDWTRKGFLSCN